MNGVFLYEAMGGIRPAYVDEAEKQTFAKPWWKKLLPLAACLMIVVGLSLGGLRLLSVQMPAVPTLLEPSAPEQAMQPDAPENSCCALCEVDPLLHPLSGTLDGFVCLLCVLIPLVGLLKRWKPGKIHAVSMGLYAAYLLSCILYVWLAVTYGWWNNLRWEILSMLKYGGVLLVEMAAVNGLLYVSNRKRAVVLALLAALLLFVPEIPERDLIEESGVYSLEVQRNVPDMVELINRYGGKSIDPAESYPHSDTIAAVIHMDDGSFYELHYVYDSGFSFYLFRFGEDEVHYVLNRYDTAGELTAAWRLNHRFEQAYLK